MDIFDDLNDKQIEAIKVSAGPVLILAGAGSGKTKTLTHRIAYLISQGIRPENILAVTFTNKAAEEMRSRVQKLLTTNYKLPTTDLFIGTFHSFGVKILREEIEKLGFKNNFVIYDEDDTFALAKDIRSELNFPQDKLKAGMLLNIVSKSKNELKDLEEVLTNEGELYRNRILQFGEIYKQRMSAANAVDFDDLIVLPVKIFQKFPEILKKYQNRYQYILVDEYQDTNHAQYTLVNLLADKYKNLFAIGDPDQAIYGWRQADFRNILNFEHDYSNAKIIKLEQNYRSTQNILSAASQIISKNVERKEKTLWTKNPPGAPIEVTETANEREEAEFIINKVLDLNKNLNIGLDNAVVMYRTNAQSRTLEEACLYAGLPYRVIGAVKFFQRKEIKDIVAFLRLIQNSDDEISLKRVVGIMGKRAYANFEIEFEKLKKTAKTLSPAELIKAVIKKTSYYDYLSSKFSGTGPDGEPESESRIKNVRELIGLSFKYDKTEPVLALSEFLAEAALMTENPPPLGNALRASEKNIPQGWGSEKLNLMTLHSAKGLEFDAVFIAGAEEGLMPHSRSAFSLGELEEERRLCYVGLTRAKKYLWLSFAKQRSLWGERNETMPSRFIMELPPSLVNFRSLSDGYNLPEINLE
ncbi:MAG: UvrD-helicase domain-containing protein [Parcubacteria group bacterium]|nr:UvrD-helicase domain-containing protein [Parcubacteria group bacterium]